MKWDNAKVKFILQKKDIKNVNDMHEILNNLLERIEAIESRLGDCPMGGYHQGALMMDHGVEVNVCKKCGNHI